jgi:transcriptional regulator with XRE-family HTH domain
MEDRYDAETRRLAERLIALAETKGVSIRKLEEKMGVGHGIFRKILQGQTKMQVRHLLMILDALEVRWGDFFQAAYRGRSAAPAGAVGEEDPEFDRKLRRALRRFLLADEAPDESGGSPH